jgi:hypothetical protein
MITTVVSAPDSLQVLAVRLQQAGGASGLAMGCLIARDVSPNSANAPANAHWGTLYDIVEWVIRLGALAVVPFRRKFAATAWLLLIFFLPIPGLLLFLMIGEPRFPQERIDRFRALTS